MIELPRGLARSFRAVSRKCSTGRPKGPAPPVLVRASRGRLTLTRTYPEAVVSVDVPLADAPREHVVLPGDVFDWLDTAGPVELHVGGETLFARLVTPGGPRDVPFEPVPVESIPEPKPIRSDRLVPVDPSLRVALHECGRCASRESGVRYATERLQVQGPAGRVVGTDGKHVLLWAGFAFPFAEDLLVPALPVFGTRDLADAGDVRIGRTEAHLVVAVGPWTVRLGIDSQGRFPDVNGVIPRPRGGTTLELAEGDAARLIALFERPGPASADDEDPDGVVVLELGPQCVARLPARFAGAAVALAQSTATGPAVAVSLNRVHLVRALTLGLRCLHVVSPNKPVAFRDGDRLLVTMPMSGESDRPADPDPEPVAIETPNPSPNPRLPMIRTSYRGSPP